MTHSAIALGANVPHRHNSLANTLTTALRLLESSPDIRVIRRSRWYRSPAYPAGSGPDFINGAALIDTNLGPAEILAELHRVEEALGRERTTRWAPRVCDLDLLFSGNEISPDPVTLAEWVKIDLGKAQTVTPPHLILPHPRLHERAFVLFPLQEIAPDWVHPLLKKTVIEMASSLAASDTEALVPLDG